MNVSPILLAIIDFDITIGNIITIVCGGVAFIVAWQKLSDKLVEIERRMKLVEETLSDLGKTGVPVICQLHADRLEEIEHRLETLLVIANDVTWIKKSLEARDIRDAM